MKDDDKKKHQEQVEKAEQKLKEAQEDRLQARTILLEKQERIANGMRLADPGNGQAYDFSKSDALSHFGASDSQGAVLMLRRWNDEAELLGIKSDNANAQVRTLQQEVNDLLALVDEGKARDQRPADLPSIPGGAAFTQKGLGQLIVESETFKQFKSTNTPGKGFIEGYDLKTLFQTSAGWPPESTRVPGLVIPAVTRPIQVIDIIPMTTTGMAAVVYMEETTRTHASAERAEAAAYVASEFALTERSSTVRSIGTSIPVTDEQLEDVEGVQGYLEQRLVFGNRQRLDSEILTGDGIAPNLTGIHNAGGLQTQAKGADPVPDAVYKAMTKIRVTGRAFPNAVIFHPNDWQGVRLLRTADGIYIWGSPSEAGPERIWGVQVVQSDAETENTALVGDFFNFCQLYERRGMEVVVGYVNDDLTKGKRTIRAGFRVAFVTYRGAAFCTVTSI